MLSVLIFGELKEKTTMYLARIEILVISEANALHFECEMKL